MQKAFTYMILILLVTLVLSCKNGSTHQEVKNNTNDSIEASETNETKEKLDLTDNQLKVLNGAKATLAEGYDYDMAMAYYTLTYKDGVNTGNKVYPNGDLDPSIGVCTDVIVRGFRKAGITDLQEELYKDINKSIGDYPMSRWGKKKADNNIDHRRVMNLEVWFAKYWQVMDKENFQPGDIVVWDMNQDGASDHIGIVSDKSANGNYYVIHNHPDPGYVAEEDKLHRWEIAGHFRIKD